MRRRRRSPSGIPGAAAAPAGGGASATSSGSTRRIKAKTKPPILIEGKRSSRSPSSKTPPTKLTSNVSSKAAKAKAEAAGAGVGKLSDDRLDDSGDEIDHHDEDNENRNNGGRGRAGARTPRVSPGPGARPRLRPRPKQRPSPPPASLPSSSSAPAPSSDRRVGFGGDTKSGGANRVRGRDSGAGAGKDATSSESIPTGASRASAGGSPEVAPAGWKTAFRVGATTKAVVGEGPEEEKGKVKWGGGELVRYCSEKDDPRLLVFVGVYITLTDPLRIQPWPQDGQNQTKPNREYVQSMFDESFFWY